MTKATLVSNGRGRTFVYINNQPTFISFDHEVKTVKLIKGGKRGGVVEVDGKQYPYGNVGTRGVVDNRHRNWRKRR